MTATSSVGPFESRDAQLPPVECEAVLQRACFGHLAFLWEGHADVQPIRYVWLDGWVYFRADRRLRKVIGHSPWLVRSVTELQDAMHISSVIVRGGCYETERTGTMLGDANALLGIVALRDPAGVGSEHGPRLRRSSTVFRLHVDEMRGLTVSLPRRAR